MTVKRHFLVTAGNTHEMIDEVREWSNIFTGKTGLDLALALLDLGDVTLLTSNPRHIQEYDGFRGKAGTLGAEGFRTHADLRQLLEERIHGTTVNGVLMTAAVSDYTPAGVYRVVKRMTGNEAGGTNNQEVWVVENVQAGKVKSSHGTIAVLGETTEKLVDLFRAKWKYRGLLIKFKLEVGLSEERLIEVAKASRVTSGAEYIVANTLEMVRGENPGAYVIGETMCERVDRAALAGRIKKLVEEVTSP